jgi:hypothetical protein
MRSILGLLAASAALIVPASANGDGGTLRVSQTVNGVIVTVFTSPSPCRAGLVDVSVFLQDAANGKTLFDVRVTVRLEQGKRVSSLPATHLAATNKLFQAAQFEGIDPGPCRVAVEVGGKPAVAFKVDVAPALPGWLDLAWWIAWPGIAVGLFGVHRLLLLRRCNSRVTDSVALPSEDARS